MNIIEKLIKEAKKDKKTIILPETNDIRVLKAAEKIDFANIILIGNKNSISTICKKENINIENVKIIDPENYEKTEELINKFYDLRKHKGITLEEAKKLIKTNYLYFGCMLVKLNLADGLVAGACTTSSDVLRAALQTVKTAPDTKLVSSFFIMELENKHLGENGIFIYSDCGLNINPNSDELVEIAASSAKSFKQLINKEPKIAMLSHSTYGSSKAESATKVKLATEKFKELYPDIVLDGEMQLDAALVPEIQKSKAPNSPLKGMPNILIFPDIDSGNIAYKLTERLANAKAYGPITQGMNKPINDLSRGCNSDDIVGAVAITCIQAK